MTPAPAHRLSRLRLALFRSWRGLRLEIPGGRSVILTGPNGAGKTNLLEALSLMAPGRGLRGASPDEFARRPERAGWRIEGLWGSDELAVGADAEGRRFARLNDKEAARAALGAAARLTWLTPALDRLFMESPGDRRRFLDRLTLPFRPDHADNALNYERAMRERARLLEEGAPDRAWLDALEHEMAAAGAALAEARAQTLALLAESAPPAPFPQAEMRLTGFEADEEGFRRLLRDGRARDAAAGRALVGPHRMDLEAFDAAKGVAAALCSTGEQKSLLVGLILSQAQALARRDGAPPVLLLDEAAAHFDEDRRAALFGVLQAMGAQAFMTGTEARLFEAAAPETLRLKVVEDGDASALG